MSQFDSLGGTTDLKSVLLAQQVLSDVLDGVLRLVLSELLQRLKQRRHDVLIQVLADGQVGVDGLFLLTSLASLVALIVAALASQIVYK
eukprot:CAMPEP_0185607808 /NCGR_PEP_ID=MMETSP0436-20130131/5768_1 /TAXON_ID=626734 ORGANISM="Favella taraikaensis, Strain Fe Narragansett Bay" /NCGR_SAMPLE_ID=MMETSP0436 /ASSEMBLY_ACC=CAM_ASM_000390 /LENGTH=88 /DNA_ID=CAMNT_0028239853 /DNA_START=109 /DNA_END=375 /DNA_ORIENTATION=-